ncbi:hypothetical protein KP626_04730 [Christensenella sp. MSJ-20]|uniref:hypothetical protein n=1 Tax=Christensenella sp. MSJ-20 TaxID=2841518 RepID=UPI000D7AA0C2|nr:MAG: hypothetical protein DBY42_06155 [Bacillota bacterium]QWT56178.1 hypothetical protein KP626_04730 [Christensenella sp. MSJ-20]
MKRTALAFVLALLLLFAVGCGAKYPFAGKWQEEGTGTYYEFNNSAQLLVGEASGNVAVGASFSWEKDSDQITITVNPPGGTAQSAVVTYTLSEDKSTLTLTDVQGQKSVLKKVQ